MTKRNTKRSRNFLGKVEKRAPRAAPRLARNPRDDKGVYVDWQRGKYSDPVEVRIETDEFNLRGDERVYLFQFSHGGIGTPTFIAVIGDSLEDGLEKAAEWLKDHAPGYFVDDENLKELHEEALEETGGDEDAAYEKATADLTYTESGYLESWNWYVDELTRGKLRDAIISTASMQQALGERKFSETEGYPRTPKRRSKRTVQRFDRDMNPKQTAAMLAKGRSR